MGMVHFKFALGDRVSFAGPDPRPYTNGIVMALTVTDKTTFAQVMWTGSKDVKTLEPESNLSLRS